MPIRKHFDVVGHKRWELPAIVEGSIPINNIIIKAGKPEDEWLEESMSLIGEWRAIFRSIYIKWAVAINGLFVAVERYSRPEWQASKEFFVTSLRADQTGKAETTKIAEWRGPDVAKNHQAVIPYMAHWGIIDLGSALEEFIFDLYRVHYWSHPEQLLQGPEFKALRKLRADSKNGESDLAKWETAFTERLAHWQRNAVYKSKRQLFINYCTTAGLKTPSNYTRTTLETWADCVNGIFILRNCLIHPNATVPKELGDFSASEWNLGYDFEEGTPLVVTLEHLQLTECFLDSLLTGLNFSLVERSGARLPEREQA